MAQRQKSSYFIEKLQQDLRQSKRNTRCVCFVKYMCMHPYTTAKGKYANSKDVHACTHGTQLILMW